MAAHHCHLQRRHYLGSVFTSTSVHDFFLLLTNIDCMSPLCEKYSRQQGLRWEGDRQGSRPHVTACENGGKRCVSVWNACVVSPHSGMVVEDITSTLTAFSLSILGVTVVESVLLLHGSSVSLLQLFLRLSWFLFSAFHYYISRGSIIFIYFPQNLKCVF